MGSDGHLKLDIIKNGNDKATKVLKKYRKEIHDLKNKIKNNAKVKNKDTTKQAEKLNTKDKRHKKISPDNSNIKIIGENGYYEGKDYYVDEAIDWKKIYNKEIQKKKDHDSGKKELNWDEQNWNRQGIKYREEGINEDINKLFYDLDTNKVIKTNISHSLSTIEKFDKYIDFIEQENIAFIDQNNSMLGTTYNLLVNENKSKQSDEAEIKIDQIILNDVVENFNKDLYEIASELKNDFDLFNLLGLSDEIIKEKSMIDFKLNNLEKYPFLYNIIKLFDQDLYNKINNDISDTMNAYKIDQKLDDEKLWMYHEGFKPQKANSTESGKAFYFGEIGQTAWRNGNQFMVKLNGNKKTSFGYTDDHTQNTKNEYSFGSIPNLSESFMAANKEYPKEAIVGVPEQIHVFGSDDDIKQFKKWEKNQNQNNASIETVTDNGQTVTISDEIKDETEKIAEEQC